MSLQAARMLASLLVTCVITCQGLDVTFNRTPESQYCGQLRCDVTVNQADPHIAYIMGLSIYNISWAQTAVKLASVSLFDPGLYIDPSKVHVINGTGSLTTSRGHLALSFQEVANCLHGTFLCQLDFVNVSGQPDTVTVSTSLGDSSGCGSLADQLGVLTSRMDNLTSDIRALTHENTVLQDADLHLQRSIDNVTQVLKLENLDLQRSLDNVTQTLKQETTLLQNKNQDLQRSLENVTQTLKQETTLLQNKNQDLQRSLENVTQTLKQEMTLLQNKNQDLQRSLENVTQTLKQETTLLQNKNQNLQRSLENVTQTLKQETTLLQNKNQNLQRSLENVTQTLRLENMDLQRTLDNVTQTLKHDNLNLQSALDNVTQTLKHDNLILQSALKNIVQRLAKLEGLGNSSINTTQVLESSCSKGVPSTASRQEFLLWGRVPALCDTETDGGRWVIIQRRTKGDVDFYRGWADYKNGFGTPDTDYWIGLDVIHNLTSQGYNELRFDLKFQGKNYFQRYSNFLLADELAKYRLSVGEDTGTAGDSFSYNNGRQFSTGDSDNDLDSRNCASLYRGPWWHYACSYSNLNGQWATDGYTGFQWRSLAGLNSLDATEMKVRQV